MTKGTHGHREDFRHDVQANATTCDSEREWPRRDSNDPLRPQGKRPILLEAVRNPVQLMREAVHLTPTFKPSSDAWPTLPESVKADILAMVTAEVTEKMRQQVALP